MQDDEKALYILEKAVKKAQDSLVKTKYFQPFLMLLTETGSIEIYENKVKDTINSYEKLEEELTQRLKVTDIEVMVLVLETLIPKQLSEGITSGIRLHLEEKSQQNKKISARFLYVPYELCRKDEGADIFVRLYRPIPVGFPAEYII